MRWLLVVAALAVVTGCGSTGVSDVATKTATVARTHDASLVAVQRASGEYCLTLVVERRRAAKSCVNTPVRGDGTGSVFRRLGRLAYGRITDAGAAVLDASSAGLPAHVRLRHAGFFLVDVPHAADGKHGDVTILGADGSTIRRACVYVGTAAAGSGGLGAPGGCADLAPIVPQPILADARQLVTLKLTRPFRTFGAGDTIGLWRAPNRARGACTFIALANVRPTRREAMRCGGAAIPGGIEFTQSTNLLGGLTPPNVARVELIGANGRRLPIAFATAAFLAELPPTGGPFRVVAYDVKGKKLASRQLP